MLAQWMESLLFRLLVHGDSQLCDAHCNTNVHAHCVQTVSGALQSRLDQACTDQADERCLVLLSTEVYSGDTELTNFS
jgi:hypothetical protein